ncbi:MAG: metallophosphoesterase [Phycisphaerales bacterium]
MSIAPNHRDPGAVIEAFLAAAEQLTTSPVRHGSVHRIPLRGRLLATGDLHDNPVHYQRIVAAARLGASRDHHVVLHELIHGDRLINGMDFSYRMLLEVAALCLAHPGQVHPILANHELSQLTGAGVSKGGGNSVELFLDAVHFVFSADGDEVEAAVNSFLAAMPLALIASDMDDANESNIADDARPSSAPGILCSHSLPSAALFGEFDPSILDRPLEDVDRRRPTGDAYLMTWGRGYDETVIEALAARWNIGMFILGHQFVESGIETVGDRVVILNSDHESGRVLPIDLADPPRVAECPMFAMPLAGMG